jgi:hypothetical protein
LVSGEQTIASFLIKQQRDLDQIGAAMHSADTSLAVADLWDQQNLQWKNDLLIRNFNATGILLLQTCGTNKTYSGKMIC